MTTQPTLGLEVPPIEGLPVSVKDLFDVAGEATTAGSTVLRDAPPATQDAGAVQRLLAAGAGRRTQLPFGPFLGASALGVALFGAPLVEALYDGSSEKFIDTEMTFEDGRKGRVRATVKIMDVRTFPAAEPLHKAAA